MEISLGGIRLRHVYLELGLGCNMDYFHMIVAGKPRASKKLLEKLIFFKRVVLEIHRYVRFLPYSMGSW